MLGFLLVPVFGVLTIMLALRGMTPVERRVILGGFVLHVVCALGLVVYHENIYHGGDMLRYAEFGTEIARYLRVNFLLYAPDLVKVIMQADNDLPVAVFLEGSAAGTMAGVTGFLMYFTDDSLFASCILVGFFSFGGLMGIYRAVRDQLSEPERQPLLYATLLVPSVSFWSAGIIKEAFLIGFLGMLVENAAAVLQKRRLWNALGIVVGAYGISLVKPYALFPLALAFGGLFYASRERKISLLYKILAIVVAIGGLVLLTRLFPAFGVEQLGATAARSRQNFAYVGSIETGAGIDLGDEGQETSLTGQLKFAPLGLLNVLARPALFEMRNITMGIAALEMTVLVAVIFSSIRYVGLKRFFLAFRERPYLFFSAIFVLSFGTAVGITTTNLGSMSRYRTPMMPFYLGSVLAVRARILARRKVEAAERAARRTGLVTQAAAAEAAAALEKSATAATEPAAPSPPKPRLPRDIAIARALQRGRAKAR